MGVDSRGPASQQKHEGFSIPACFKIACMPEAHAARKSEIARKNKGIPTDDCCVQNFPYPYPLCKTSTSCEARPCAFIFNLSYHNLGGHSKGEQQDCSGNVYRMGTDIGIMSCHALVGMKKA